MKTYKPLFSWLVVIIGTQRSIVTKNRPYLQHKANKIGEKLIRKNNFQH